eukprot:gene11468-biopygen9417
MLKVPTKLQTKTENGQPAPKAPEENGKPAPKTRQISGPGTVRASCGHVQRGGSRREGGGVWGVAGRHTLLGEQDIPASCPRHPKPKTGLGGPRGPRSYPGPALRPRHAHASVLFPLASWRKGVRQQPPHIHHFKSAQPIIYLSVDQPLALETWKRAACAPARNTPRRLYTSWQHRTCNCTLNMQCALKTAIRAAGASAPSRPVWPR